MARVLPLLWMITGAVLACSFFLPHPGLGGLAAFSALVLFSVCCAMEVHRHD